MQPQTSWPPSQLHENAKAAFDKRAENLANSLIKRSPLAQPDNAFLSRHPPDLTIALDSTPDDWIAEITDFHGRTKGRYFINGGQEFAIIKDNYKKLRELSIDITKKSIFKSGFSIVFIEKTAFKWIKLFTLSSVDNFTEYLTSECSKHFKIRRLLVPLDFIEIEQNFTLGGIAVRTISQDLIDLTEIEAEQRHGALDNRHEFYNKLRHKFSNRTAVDVTIAGESEYVREKALEIASDMAGILRFISPASQSAVAPSLIHPAGYSHTPSLTTIEISDELIDNINTKHMRYGLARWQQPHAHLDRLMKLGLDKLAIFFDGRPLNNYACKVREAFRVYCRAIGQLEPQDRIIGAISALESLFLGNDSVPLMHTVSERLAFLISKEKNGRKRIVKTYKAAYSLRSRIVHHSAPFEDEETADAFFRDASIAFHQAIRGLSCFKTHQDFLDFIDDIKFGGIVPTELAA